MSRPDCSDVCEIIHAQLSALGFKVPDDEDHTDMIEMLAQSKLVREHTPDGEKIWSLWDLTQGTIEAVAKEKGISIAGKNLDEIARLTKKGIEAALDFVWEEAVENAIKGTKADWKFNIVDRSLIDSSEHRNGISYELTETWTGEVECKSEGASFVFDFELLHHITEDNGGDTAKITSSKPDDFNEDEWDDLLYATTDFIETAYRAEYWTG
jgi:hypothetical protein